MYVPKTQHSSTPQSSELVQPRNDGLFGYATAEATIKIVAAARANDILHVILFILSTFVFYAHFKICKTKINVTTLHILLMRLLIISALRAFRVILFELNRTEM